MATGLGATAVGYFIQGWFKFGGVEFFKTKAAIRMGEKDAYKNRTAIYLGSAACAEFIADIFLCPLEACRIRAVSDPTYANGLAGVATRLMKEEGILRGFYSGFGPILFKQVPYTMAKFAVQGATAEKIYGSLGKTPEQMGAAGNLGVALSSGVVAGVIAAIISHPADTLLSKMNKAGEGGTGWTKIMIILHFFVRIRLFRLIFMNHFHFENKHLYQGSIPSRMMNVTKNLGIVNLCTSGLGARYKF